MVVFNKIYWINRMFLSGFKRFYPVFAMSLRAFFCEAIPRFHLKEDERLLLAEERRSRNDSCKICVPNLRCLCEPPKAGGEAISMRSVLLALREIASGVSPLAMTLNPEK